MYPDSTDTGLTFEEAIHYGLIDQDGQSSDKGALTKGEIEGASSWTEEERKIIEEAETLGIFE